MQIQLRFFASVREALACSQEQFAVPDGVRTAAEVRQLLQARGPVWAEALAETRGIRMAFNQEMIVPDTLLTDGGELAFFPPVTGG